MDNNDIIIALVDHIKKQGAEFTLTFDKVEADLFLPQDSVSENLETAASEAGYEVVRRGSSTASLRKKQPKRPSSGSVPIEHSW